MIEFFELTMKNFLSYGNTKTTVDLSRPGSTLVTGRNLDGPPDGTASNGVGKTAIQNAIVYALYDKPLSNITKDNLVNYVNGKHMEVSVTFRVDTVYYKIVRARKMKAGPYGNWAKLYSRVGDLNFADTDEVTLDSNSNTNDEIVKRIGVPYELFTRIVASSARHVPFLSMPSKHPTQPSQQSFIEELFDLKTLTMKADVLKDQIKANESAFTLMNAKAEIIDRQKESHAKQLAETRRKQSEWEANRLDDIRHLKQTLERIEGVDLDEQEQVWKSIEDLKESRTMVDNQMRAAIRDHREASDHLKKLSGEHTHLSDATCPYCKQGFTASGDAIATLEETIAALGGAIQEIEAAQVRRADHMAAYSTKISALRDQLQFDDLQELLQIKFKKTEIASSIESLETGSNSVNPFTSMVEMVESEVPEEIDQDARNALVEELEHQKFLHKLLTKNDSFIRKAMLNKNLPFLNKRLNYYLRRMELPHVVEFTHDLTPKITRFGSNFEFDNLSSGQQARVNLALSMSFRDVLQNLHQKINLFCLDEVLDVGLDVAGVMMAAKLLKEEARRSGTCMFIVSHREEISASFDKKMYVLFENSFSRTYQTTAEIAVAEAKLHTSS